MNYKFWFARGLLLGPLLGACSVDAIDYRGKSCATAECPSNLICVPQTLTCEHPSTFASGGSSGNADGKNGSGGSSGQTADRGSNNHESAGSGGADDTGGTASDGGTSSNGGSNNSGASNTAGAKNSGGSSTTGADNSGGSSTTGADNSGGSSTTGANNSGGSNNSSASNTAGGNNTGASNNGGAIPQGDAGQGGSAGEGAANHAGGTPSSGGIGATNASGMGGEAGAVNDDPWGGTTERLFYVTAAWQDYYLSICYRSFVDRGDEQATLDFWQHTRALVESTWGRSVHRPLQHFGRCDQQSEHHHFEVSLFSTGQSSSGLGDPGTGDAQQIHLNIHATDIEILYVFGRALGFKHEYDRHAYTGTCVRCTSTSQCTVGDRRTCLASGYCGNPADHESIMAAPDCGGLESSRRFSAWDAMGAQRAYGAMGTRTMVDASAHCLNVGGGTGVPGERMMLFPCGQPRGDTFRWQSDDDPNTSDELSAPFGSSSVCLTFTPALPSAPAPQLFTATCNTSAPEQNFHLDAVHLRAMGNMCVAAASATVGAGLGVYDCATEQARPELARWSLHGQAIELTGSGLCISVPTLGSDQTSTHLTLAPCTVPSPHSLTFDSGLLLIDWSGGGSVAGCVRVADANPTPGSALLVSPSCDSRANALFYITGPIMNSGKCMDHLGLIADDETPVGLVPCTGDARQEWDYHP